VEYATGTRDLRQMGGLGKMMPVTSTTNFIASMSIAGMPPFSGFWSKLIIIIAAVQAGHLGYAIWAVMVSVLTLALFAGVLRDAFWGEPSQNWQGIREVPRYMQFSMLGLALISVMSGILLLPNIKVVFLQPAAAIFIEGANYAHVILGII